MSAVCGDGDKSTTGSATVLLLSILFVAAVTVSVAASNRTTTSAAVPRYAVAAVTRGDVVDAIEATGTLQMVETVGVSTLSLAGGVLGILLGLAVRSPSAG